MVRREIKIGKVLLQTLPYQTNIWIFRKIKCLFGFMIFQWSVFYLEKYIFPFLNFWEQFCYFPFKRNLIDMALAACAWGSGSANLLLKIEEKLKKTVFVNKSNFIFKKFK